MSRSLYIYRVLTYPVSRYTILPISRIRKKNVLKLIPSREQISGHHEIENLNMHNKDLNLKIENKCK